jgi:hypothetical protein
MKEKSSDSKAVSSVYTTVSVYFFGKPEWEFEAGKITSKQLKKFADLLRDRLYDISKILDILIKNGWKRWDGGLYDTMFSKDISKKEAVIELKRIGVEPKSVMIVEQPIEG